ncbi:MAG: hypothetical protein JWQ03_1341, partial [Variovorax sp.]|nr:hypothetical protein [Variovorax sp.]
AARSLQGNAMADALPLFEALATADAQEAGGAHTTPGTLDLPLSPSLSLRLRLTPIDRG